MADGSKHGGKSGYAAETERQRQKGYLCVVHNVASCLLAAVGKNVLASACGGGNDYSTGLGRVIIGKGLRKGD